MAYNYDVDILAALWTGAEDGKEPYATTIAANPTLVNEVSENRILSSIELLRSHMALLASREEANMLHFGISRLIRHAAGSDPFSAEAAITLARGNVSSPNFPAGASFDITINGVTASPASTTGGNCQTVVAELNADLDGIAAEETEITATDDEGGNLGGLHFTLNSASDATAYYVWLNHLGVPEEVSLNFTAITGETLPTGATPAASFDITVPGGNIYRCWYSDGSTTAPAADEEILVPIAFIGGEGEETDQDISDLTLAALIGADAEFVNFVNGGGTTPIITGAMVTGGDVTDPVDGAVATGAVIASTTQGIAAAVDPAPMGLTAIPVLYIIDDGATDLGNKIATAINNNADFTATDALSVVTVTNATTGSATDATAATSGFTILVTNQGVDIFINVVCIQPDNRISIVSQAEFDTFTLANGTGGIIGPGGVIPGEYPSTPKRVADEGRNASINNIVGKLQKIGGL
jgi:hypothetical protein